MHERTAYNTVAYCDYYCVCDTHHLHPASCDKYANGNRDGNEHEYADKDRDRDEYSYRYRNGYVDAHADEYAVAHKDSDTPPGYVARFSG